MGITTIIEKTSSKFALSMASNKILTRHSNAATKNDKPTKDFLHWMNGRYFHSVKSVKCKRDCNEGRVLQGILGRVNRRLKASVIEMAK